MNCSLCGEVCRCHSEPPPASVAEPGAEALSSSASPVFTLSEPLCLEPEAAVSQPDPSAWRGELSARLDRYRARRKMRPPRYPSLNLQFSPPPSMSNFAEERDIAENSFTPISDQALALDVPRSEVFSGDKELHRTAADVVPVQSECLSAPSGGAKIIEFPRFSWTPPAPPPDQLAEPVNDVPRILEVPEIAPPPPALGGITIEASEREHFERRPGIDIPLQAASLERRIAASLVDAFVVLLASAVFGLIFWKVTAVRPPRFEVLGLGAAIPLFLWLAYQYLLIVYGGTTPGLRVAGLNLARFDGSHPSRQLRRWRVLGSYLSAASLGMGYAWVFLDEDALCWHDRITHTYLAPRPSDTSTSSS